MTEGTYEQAEKLFLNTIINKDYDVITALERVRRRYGSNLSRKVRERYMEYRIFFKNKY